MRHSDSTNPDTGESCHCETEVWQCQGGPIDVAIDAAGCPVSPKYCKQHAGSRALAVATGAAFTITIAVGNLSEARVRAFIMEASDPAALIPGISALPNVEVTGITLLQNTLVSGQITASRFAHDVTGPNFSGLSSWVRGKMGTAGGTLVVTGVNRSAITLEIWAAVDVDGVVG